MIYVYGKKDCYWCDQAKRLLQIEGFRYTFIDVSDVDARNEMLDRVPNATTVPQVFVNERHIGGYSELSSYLANFDEV